MKKLYLCLLVLLFTCILCSCGEFEVPKSPLAILTQLDEPALIDTSLIGKKDEYSIVTKAIAQGEEEAAIRAFEKVPFAIVVCGNLNEESIISVAKEQDIAVIFINSDISNETLDSYDKAWNLYAVANHAGELLGLDAANAFKNGELADPNQDGMLQCTIISNTKSNAINSAIVTAADLGVYSNETYINAKTAQEVETIFTETYQDALPPEIIFCDDLELLKGAQTALNALSQTSTFALLHTSNTTVDISSPELLTCAKFPFQEILDACNTFLDNIVSGEAVTNNSDYRLNNHKVSVFKYILN